MGKKRKQQRKQAVSKAFGNNKELKKLARKALKIKKGTNKGRKVTKKEIKQLQDAGATKQQLQSFRKQIKKSNKLKIGKRVDQKKEINTIFKNSGDDSGPGSGENNTNKGGKNNSVKVGDLPSRWQPDKVEKSVRKTWFGKDGKGGIFGDYKGPQRLQVNPDKLYSERRKDSRLSRFSKYNTDRFKKNKDGSFKTDKDGKKIRNENFGQYTGFDMKAYKSELKGKLEERYKSQGGTEENVARLIKRDAPKANFEVNNKYANAMDNLERQLGGKKTIEGTTQALTSQPRNRSSDFKDTGLSIINSRTAEEAGTKAPRPDTIRKKRKQIK